MKKLLLISLLLTGFMASTFAQTIVGTDPENKNVVLEEFTGIHCTYCPDGHAIAQGIYDMHPEDVILVNVHVGPFAAPSGGEPDYRTPWGAALDGQAGVAGYPAGTVNRHLFPGWGQQGGTAMSRNYWVAASDQIMASESYLNVGCESFLTAAGQLTVNVEVYYTGDSPESVNFLNVAILQNNVFGPQTGGGAGNNYQHMHMLRHFITGQWGVEITETTEGSLYSNTFTYDIPADYNGVPVVLEDLDVVAYVAEGHQEIVSGTKGTVTMEAAYDYDATVSEVFFPLSQACAGDLAPRIEIKNYGDVTMTSATIEYSVNEGDLYTYEWTGELEYTHTEEIVLPGVPYDMETENSLTISITNPNGETDENPNNNESVTNFEAATETSTSLEMQLFVGAWAHEISWEFVNGEGEVLAEGDNYETNEVVNMELPIAGSGCYTFYLYDSGNDGFAGGGYLKIYDDGVVIAYITDELESTWDMTMSPLNPLAAPMDFEAAIEAYDISFSWSAPSKANLLGYNIYEATDMQTPINTTLIDATEYMFTVSNNGDYEFYLAAVYDEGMSDLVGPVFAGINVGISELANGALNIYPNPVHENATLSFVLKESAQVEVSVYSLVGSLVYEIPAQTLNSGQQNVQINTTSLEEGIYFVNLLVNGESITKKITVLK